MQVSLPFREECVGFPNTRIGLCKMTLSVQLESLTSAGNSRMGDLFFVYEIALPRNTYKKTRAVPGLDTFDEQSRLFDLNPCSITRGLYVRLHPREELVLGLN